MEGEACTDGVSGRLRDRAKMVSSSARRLHGRAGDETRSRHRESCCTGASAAFAMQGMSELGDTTANCPLKSKEDVMREHEQNWRFGWIAAAIALVASIILILEIAMHRSAEPGADNAHSIVLLLAS